jgi:hypothetical protein
MCAFHYSTVSTCCQYVCVALQHSAYLLSVCVRCITAQYVPTVSMCPSRYRAMRTTVSMCALRYSTVRTYCQYVRVPLQGNAYLMSEWKWSYSSTHSWTRHWKEVSGQLHAPAALPPGKSPCYLLDRSLGGPQSRSGHSSGEEKIPSPCRDSNSRSSSPYRSTIPLSYLNSYSAC